MHRIEDVVAGDLVSAALKENFIGEVDGFREKIDTIGGAVLEYPLWISGDTLSEAFANACEALDLHLETLQKLGQPVPPCKHRLVVEAA